MTPIYPKYVPVAKRERIERLGLRRPPAMDADGIERFVRDGHLYEVCHTPEAMEERRNLIFARSGGHCEGCGFSIGYSTFDFHHVRGRTKARRCDCPACVQALCKDAIMRDNSVRPGCHSMAHLAIDGEGKFDPERSTRLGAPFQRGDQT